jgi:hypothetical protein
MTADKKETIRLGRLVDTFQIAAMNRVLKDQTLQSKLDAVMTPADEKRLQDIEETATAKMFGKLLTAQNKEDVDHFIAENVLAYADEICALFIRAAVDADLADAFPAAEKTEANAQALRDRNAPNVAILCLK